MFEEKTMKYKKAKKRSSPYFSIIVDEETHCEFKTTCSEKGLQMKDTAIEILKNWIAKKKKPQLVPKVG